MCRLPNSLKILLGISGVTICIVTIIDLFCGTGEHLFIGLFALAIWGMGTLAACR